MFVSDPRSAEMLRSRYLLVIGSSGRIEKGTRHTKPPQLRGCPRNCKRQVRSLKTTGLRFGAFGEVESDARAVSQETCQRGRPIDMLGAWRSGYPFWRRLV